MRTWPALRLSGLASHSPDEHASTADLVHAVLSDYSVSAIQENTPDEWQVFFTSDNQRDSAARHISEIFPSVLVTGTDVADDDWAARSQSSLRAVRAGNILVAPPWDVQHQPNLLTIVIQPSMGFGTGHHATTRLCLEALQDTSLRDRHLLDVGTGSGVLAIAASLLGASAVLGIDDDADAVQAARENLAFNAASKVRFEVKDLRDLQEGPFAVVTANLTGGLLAATAARLTELTAPGGTLILSGIMSAEAADVLPRFESCAPVRRADEDEWVCVTLERPQL